MRFQQRDHRFSQLKRSATLLLGLWFLICLPVMAQAQPKGESSDSTAKGGDSGSVAPFGDYKLGAGDVISIQVFGVDRLTQEARISNSGKMHVPYLGILTVSGMTTQELESKIAAMLGERGLVKDAAVQVVVKEYRAQPVYVLGEVDLPGQYIVTDQLTLLDALTMAGGPGISAGPWGYLYRRKMGPDVSVAEEQADGPLTVPGFDVIRVDLKQLMEGESAGLNVTLRGGDFFYVPEKTPEHFFVVGDVYRPGGYELPTETLLLTQALAQAGGPTRTAKSSKSLLVRFAKDGSRREVTLDFDAILRGKAPNLPIRDSDVIFVPGSTAKTIGYGMLGIIPGFTQSVLLKGTVQGH